MSESGFQSYGEAIVTFTYGDNILGSVSFSATSLGETYLKAVDNMYAALNKLVENYFIENPTYQQNDIVYNNICAWPSGPPGLTLYYKYDIVNGIRDNNLSIYPPLSPSSLYFNNTSLMCDANYQYNNENIINFSGYNTPHSELLNLPPTEGTIVTIFLPSNGSQVTTNSLLIINIINNTFYSFPFLLFNIASASGIFANYTVMKINYNDTNPEMLTRTVEFY
jgi:hypothetical protein